jgi:fructosamine-3-kinase
VDLAYLRAHPQHLASFIHHQRIRETPVSGGSICAASRLTLDDGNSIFTKSWPGGGTSAAAGVPAATVPEGFFQAEAAGLRWLAAAGAPVPEVIAVLPDLIAMEWISPGQPDRAAAEQLGRDLAALHRAGAPRFGADWPGYIGRLPFPDEPTHSRRRSASSTAVTDGSASSHHVADPPAGGAPHEDVQSRAHTRPDVGWPGWFGRSRLAPYLEISAERGALSSEDVAVIEGVISDIWRYAGPAAQEPPARIHGDLWPGNVLWSAAGRAYLVDPAAQGGHRETDLATLALFGGVPYFDRIIAGYQEVYPLAEGWRARLPLHQLHLLLVHAAMFGSGYRDSLLAAARATVDQ